MLFSRSPALPSPRHNSPPLTPPRLSQPPPPAGRITAAEALQHPYLEALHNVNDEPSAPVFDFAMEEQNITENDLRGLIWQQLMKFHPTLGPMPASFMQT